MRYSQFGQDIFVYTVLGQPNTGTFVDIGCQRPFEINNSLLLEEKGWHGIALDILDFSREWQERSTPFIQTDALTCDYSALFKTYGFPQPIDYISIDVENNGDRFKVLERVLECGYRFKVITIEHDVYKGYYHTEQLPQRELLSQCGYVLVASDVCGQNEIPVEDWWINPDFVKAKSYGKFLSNKMTYLDIFRRAEINLNYIYQ